MFISGAKGLRMSEATPLLPLHAFMARRWASLPFIIIFVIAIVRFSSLDH